MKTHPNFEAVKVALKQDRTGYILTLNIHPDDLDERIMRDFVGSRYMVVMARIDENQQPLNRLEFVDPVKLAGILCKDKEFHAFLMDIGNIFEATEKDAADWLREELGIMSRAELKGNQDASRRLLQINEEFKQWKQND
ncbi:hypothetical protein EBT31_02345 [bacterium]|nr:hypothetical protein [bacterium]